jgi:hypothetical protein
VLSSTGGSAFDIQAEKPAMLPLILAEGPDVGDESSLDPQVSRTDAA